MAVAPSYTDPSSPTSSCTSSQGSSSPHTAATSSRMRPSFLTVPPQEQPQPQYVAAGSRSHSLESRHSSQAVVDRVMHYLPLPPPPRADRVRPAIHAGSSAVCTTDSSLLGGEGEAPLTTVSTALTVKCAPPQPSLYTSGPLAPSPLATLTSSSIPPGERLYLKSMLWKERRRCRIELQQREKERVEMAECRPLHSGPLLDSPASAARTSLAQGSTTRPTARALSAPPSRHPHPYPSSSQPVSTSAASLGNPTRRSTAMINSSHSSAAAAMSPSVSLRRAPQAAGNAASVREPSIRSLKRPVTQPLPLY